MDRRFQWPPGPQENGRFPPQNGHHIPPSNTQPFQSNGYHGANNAQPAVQRQYPSSQPAQNHPIVLIPQRSSPYQVQDEIRAQPRTPSQPRVVVPPRAPASMPHIPSPKIRQGQPQAHRSSHNTPISAARSNKPLGRSPSLQENATRPQHRTPTHQPSHNRTPLQQHSVPRPNAHPQVIIQKTGSHSTPTAYGTPSGTPSRSAPDYSVLLLAMAEEYTWAAYDMGPMAALSQRQADMERYYKLMATAMGCMEAVLTHYKLQPRSEAALRLKYASLLVEETDNSVEIEDVLSKGVALCQRHHFTDLKYSMQHLQARFLFKASHRAALKSVDQPISEAETLQHIPWIYAFRFLKVSLALQTPGHPEITTALQQLHAISAHAQRHGDRAIYVTSCAFEAMIHLRVPGQESIEQAQRSIASARSLQLQTSANELGHIITLIDILDLVCSIQQNSASEVFEKRRVLQAKVDEEGVAEEDSPSAFSVVLERSSGGKLTDLTGGIFKKGKDGRDEIIFTWLSKRDLYALAFYLSGVAGFMKTESRTSIYIKEGIKTVRDQKRPIPESVPTSITGHGYRTMLEWQMTLLLGFLACNSGDWNRAERILDVLRDQAMNPPFTNNESYERLVMYFTGAVAQGKGLLNKAISAYQSPILALPQTVVYISDFNTDIAILAAMNQILILRDPGHPEHFRTALLLSQIEPFCVKHPNRSIVTALNMIRVLTSDRDSKLSLKNALSNTLNLAKMIENFHFITIGLNLMGYLFFSDAFGEQAQKSVKAARMSSKSSGVPVWQAVASGLLMHSMRRHGQMDQIQYIEKELEKVMDKLPPQLRGTKVDPDEDQLTI